MTDDERLIALSLHFIYGFDNAEVVARTKDNGHPTNEDSDVQLIIRVGYPLEYAKEAIAIAWEQERLVAGGNADVVTADQYHKARKKFIQEHPKIGSKALWPMSYNRLSSKFGKHWFEGVSAFGYIAASQHPAPTRYTNEEVLKSLKDFQNDFSSGSQSDTDKLAATSHDYAIWRSKKLNDPEEPKERIPTAQTAMKTLGANDWGEALKHVTRTPRIFRGSRITQKIRSNLDELSSKLVDLEEQIEENSQNLNDESNLVAQRSILVQKMEEEKTRLLEFDSKDRARRRTDLMIGIAGLLIAVVTPLIERLYDIFL